MSVKEVAIDTAIKCVRELNISEAVAPCSSSVHHEQQLSINEQGLRSISSKNGNKQRSKYGNTKANENNGRKNQKQIMENKLIDEEQTNKNNIKAKTIKQSDKLINKKQAKENKKHTTNDMKIEKGIHKTPANKESLPGCENIEGSLSIIEDKVNENNGRKKQKQIMGNNLPGEEQINKNQIKAKTVKQSDKLLNKKQAKENKKHTTNDMKIEKGIHKTPANKESLPGCENIEGSLSIIEDKVNENNGRKKQKQIMGNKFPGEEQTNKNQIKAKTVKQSDKLLNNKQTRESKRHTTNDMKKEKVKHKTPANKESLSGCENIEGSMSDIEDKSPNKIKKDKQFPKYITIEEAKELLKNQDGDSLQYIQGSLRINPTYYKHAYLAMPNDEPDLLIIGIRDRNRALEGDLVVASLNPEDEWVSLPGGHKQKTGTVICIVEKVHPRKAVGHVKVNGKGLLFYPRDQRIPLLRVYNDKLWQTLQSQPNLFKDTLLVCEFTSWREPYTAIGKIIAALGDAEDIQTWVNSIIIDNDLDVTPYDDDLIVGLPSSDYVPTTADMQNREDWRQQCIFTIDPATALDLDDAVSCKMLENGNYEVGVHISDLTHYLEFFSPLDLQVAKRATTVYMADNVYPMLPKQLCELCSLLPGRDKLAFSVIWEMTPEAEIVKHRFTKTVINSCCQMAYEHAQYFIERPEEEYPADFLKIYGGYTATNLSRTVNSLFKLSTKLRKKRFDGGALRMDIPKLRMKIDKDSGLPITYSLDAQRDSNKLIEEFMLLANITVATHLYENIPETALLREHKGPTLRILNAIRDMLQYFGIHIDTESSASLQASRKRYEPDVDSETDITVVEAKYRMMVINTLCTKAMNRALYKCASTVSTIDDLRHYALSVPLYTHFTSPIRRYADCIVHRLLYASLQNVPLPDRWTPELCARIAKTCNHRKYSAALAEKQSHELYFAYLVHLADNVIVPAIVMDVKKQIIEVIHCDSGVKLKVYLNDVKENASVEFSDEDSIPTLTVTWKEPPITQVINMFTILWIQIRKKPGSFCLSGILLPPE